MHIRYFPNASSQSLITKYLLYLSFHAKHKYRDSKAWDQLLSSLQTIFEQQIREWSNIKQNAECGKNPRAGPALARVRRQEHQLWALFPGSRIRTLDLGKWMEYWKYFFKCSIWNSKLTPTSFSSELHTLHTLLSSSMKGVLIKKEHSSHN